MGWKCEADRGEIISRFRVRPWTLLLHVAFVSRETSRNYVVLDSEMLPSQRSKLSIEETRTLFEFSARIEAIVSRETHPAPPAAIPIQRYDGA